MFIIAKGFLIGQRLGLIWFILFPHTCNIICTVGWLQLSSGWRLSSNGWIAGFSQHQTLLILVPKSHVVACATLHICSPFQFELLILRYLSIPILSSNYWDLVTQQPTLCYSLISLSLSQVLQLTAICFSSPNRYPRALRLRLQPLLLLKNSKDRGSERESELAFGPLENYGDLAVIEIQHFGPSKPNSNTPLIHIYPPLNGQYLAKVAWATILHYLLELIYFFNLFRT